MNIQILVVSKEEIQKRTGFTGADWWFDEDGDLQVRIEMMSSREVEMILASHEMFEAILSKFHGITVKQVDEFDAQVEKDHPENHGIEAGDLPNCPYAREHTAATAAERIMFMELLMNHPQLPPQNVVSWREYDDELGAL